MSPLVQDVFVLFQGLILLLTALNLIYMITRLRGNRWYFYHALPLIVYSAHVLIYYLALLLRRQIAADLDEVVMAWSIALRLHGAIMVFSMARTVVRCLKNF